MPLFYRLHTDQSRVDAALENAFAGPIPSACWLIGGGPSLAHLSCDAIAGTPIPKMCINLSGTRLVRPTFWTSYDPSVRFHRSVYLDPGVMKFVHRRRAMDLVPESTFKVCECPNTYFFDRNVQRGYADFLDATAGNIVDWADSLVQAIDILYRLGFRTLYLAGCEMRVSPSREQIDRARAVGVDYDPRQLLADFVRRANAAGLSAEELDSLPPGKQYHFDEFKPIQAAANTDLHYFRIAQYLRLSRRSLSLAGLRLVSVTPGSRLNDYFPFESVRRVLRRISLDVGKPDAEPVRGLYQQANPRRPAALGPMKDYRPRNWRTDGSPQATSPPPNGRRHIDGELLVEAEGFQRLDADANADRSTRKSRLKAHLDALPAVIDPTEDG